jgi:nitrite reductase/ring-hydroxylating ferredoxin subunit
MVLNLLVVVLYAAAVVLRRGAQPVPIGAILGLEGVGTVLLSISGYLGGILVTRNQIGVDHRYAEAGRWKEASFRPGPNGQVVVAESGELAVDQMKLLRVMGKRIVLARTEDGYAAFDDHCTHRGGSLADGVIVSGQVQCPWHGSQFDCRTGAVVNGPARDRIGTYILEERAGQVILHLEREGYIRTEPRPVPIGR